MRNDRLFYGIGALGLMGLGLVWGHMAAAAIAIVAVLYLLCDRIIFGQTRQLKRFRFAGIPIRGSVSLLLDSSGGAVPRRNVPGNGAGPGVQPFTGRKKSDMLVAMTAGQRGAFILRTAAIFAAAICAVLNSPVASATELLTKQLDIVPEPLPAVERDGPWLRVCQPAAEDERCRFEQKVVASNGDEITLTLLAGAPDIALFHTPLHVLLPPGVTLAFDGRASGRVEFRACSPRGCLASAMPPPCLAFSNCPDFQAFCHAYPVSYQAWCGRGLM